MVRTALLAALLALGPSAALAQDYSGTYVSTHPSSGGKIILELKQDADQRVSGTLSGNGSSFEVDAQVEPEGLTGAITGDAVLVFLMAYLAGPELRVLLVEPGPGGAPDMKTAREMRMLRE